MTLLRYPDVAGMAGLEPTISESKSGVLPLHYIPIFTPKGSERGRRRPPTSFLWGGIWGSNPRHPEPQSGALPAELIPPNRPRKLRIVSLPRQARKLACLKFAKPKPCGFALALARQEGFEPPTYCLEGSCSILLSYWRIFMLPARSSKQILERVMGIEPTYPAWKAGVLPLNYTRRGWRNWLEFAAPSIHIQPRDNTISGATMSIVFRIFCVPVRRACQMQEKSWRKYGYLPQKNGKKLRQFSKFKR